MRPTQRSRSGSEPHGAPDQRVPGPRGGASNGSGGRAGDGATPALTSIDDVRAIYQAHGPEIFRYCRRLVGDRGLAEEATQETFLRAWRAAHRWDESLGSIRAWLFAIAHNVSTDLLRARRVRFNLPDSVREPSDDQTDPAGETPIETAMLGWVVEEGLRRIRPDQRQAIVETYYKGRTYAEVSAELGVPEGTLRSRVFYGLKALRLALEELGWEA